jgi:NADH:ubiquinone oxidoreductase subunit 4 (subunit M)
MKFLSATLVVIGVFYFFCRNILIFFVIFELSVVPVLFMILGFGIQVEKIAATYYLLFYIVLTRLPFIFFFFTLDFVGFVVYIDYILSEELNIFIIIGLLIKFTVYFLHY